MKTFLVSAAGLLLAIVVGAQAPSVETYISAHLDSIGNLLIVTTDGRIVSVPKLPATKADADDAQTSFEQPVISEDEHAVGAHANFPNCCTSYDLPMQLVVYANGKVHRFTGIGLPIFEWHFVDGGKRVAFGQEPAHFGCFVYWELWDIEPENKHEEINIPELCGQNPDPTPVTPPKWVSGKMSGLQ